MSQHAQLVALEYHYVTERYDRTISPARSERTGDALPRDGWEQGKMAAHAKQVLHMLARRENIHREALLAVIRNVNVPPYYVLERMFAPPDNIRLVVQ